jgi:hypothetical protein
MCYRCAASNQSPKTSPEDNSSSPPLPSDDLSEKIVAPAAVNVGERIIEKLNGNI